MDNHQIVLLGRSSSHFTRTTRVFAHELGAPYIFRPVLDLTTLDRTAYGGNPARKVRRQQKQRSDQLRRK
ncbi:MAG TPA: hypothetical protein VH374_14190 [Polyangia bacterium]|jgi:hypothetical protein|nr:hypothetical protein [Polyangia bacterium]